MKQVTAVSAIAQRSSSNRHKLGRLTFAFALCTQQLCAPNLLTCSPCAISLPAQASATLLPVSVSMIVICSGQ